MHFENSCKGVNKEAQTEAVLFAKFMSIRPSTWTLGNHKSLLKAVLKFVLPVPTNVWFNDCSNMVVNG